MNRDQSSDRYRNNYQDDFHTRRSDRYRHPERDDNYRFDNYGSSARGGYGNESYTGSFGNQGNEMGGSRNVSNRGLYDTYSTSKNYGNMGSYGGAQGFGSSRGGYPSQRHYDSNTDFNYDSGMGSQRDARRSQYSPGGYRAYDNDRYGRSSDMGLSSNSGNRNLYGNDTSRRFEGNRQDRYDFDRDDFNSPNYGGSQGNYMGSGYDRSSSNRGEYGSTQGNYGSQGEYERYRDSQSNRYNDPYGSSGYFRGGYGTSPQDHYIKSGNQTRSFDRNHDRFDNRQH